MHWPVLDDNERSITVDAQTGSVQWLDEQGRRHEVDLSNLRHQEEMARTQAVMLANRAQIDREEREKVRKMQLVHDIGTFGLQETREIFVIVGGERLKLTEKRGNREIVKIETLDGIPIILTPEKMKRIDEIEREQEDNKQQDRKLRMDSMYVTLDKRKKKEKRLWREEDLVKSGLR